MKHFVFLFCLFAGAGSFAAKVEPIQTEQTLCSLLTGYELGLKHCTEEIKKGEEKCKEEMGFFIPNFPHFSQDESDTLMAIYTDIHNVCVAEDADKIQCIFEKMTSAKEEHCTNSD